MIRWQGRKESPHRGKQAVITMQHLPTPKPPRAKIIPERYEPLQCPFCLSDTRLPPLDREKRKSKTNKLWDHIENIHRQELAAFDTGNRRCVDIWHTEYRFHPFQRAAFQKPYANSPWDQTTSVMRLLLSSDACFLHCRETKDRYMCIDRPQLDELL